MCDRVALDVPVYENLHCRRTVSWAFIFDHRNARLDTLLRAFLKEEVIDKGFIIGVNFGKKFVCRWNRNFDIFLFLP